MSYRDLSQNLTDRDFDNDYYNALINDYKVKYGDFAYFEEGTKAAVELSGDACINRDALDEV